MRHTRFGLLLLITGLQLACFYQTIKYEEPETTTGPEDPAEVAARELRRQGWSEIERSRAAPVALESAAALALAAEKLFPGTPDNYILLADARGRAGEVAGAAEALAKALAADPDNADLEADLELARAGVPPGKPHLPDFAPPEWLKNVKVELKFPIKRHRYDEPLPAEISVRNLGREPVVFDPVNGVDPVVQMSVLVHRKSQRYDYYGMPLISFRATKQLGPGEALERTVDVNNGTVSVALAAYAPHYSRVLAFRASLMGDRGQPWALDSEAATVPYEGVPILTSVLDDIEKQLFIESVAERLHLIKLYGHLVSGAPLPEAFAPRFEPYDHPREKARANLLRLLKDPEPLVRGTAIRAVVGLGDDAGPEALDRLTEALTDKDSWFVRGQAAYALAKLQGKAAMTNLRTVSTEDPDETVQMLAAAAMMQVDPTLAPPPEPEPEASPAAPPAPPKPEGEGAKPDADGGPATPKPEAKAGEGT